MDFQSTEEQGAFQTLVSAGAVGAGEPGATGFAALTKRLATDVGLTWLTARCSSAAREVMRLIISRDVLGEIDQGEVHNCR